MEQQGSAVLGLLELRDDIALPDARVTAPVMATIGQRHRRLNVMNLEAVAAAHVLGAAVWLSENAAAGILPGVLDAEKIQWSTVSIAE